MNGYLIYGFQEKEENCILDEEWLEEHYPGINVFASEIIRHHAGQQMIYGFVCNVNRDTGVPVISDGTKEFVKKLYEQYLTCKNVPANDVSLGFYLGMSGDYEVDHTRYRLDE